MAPVIDLVRHYQHNIEKYPGDKQKVLRAIDKLFQLDVKVQHLQETGVGRTVNALRKQPEEIGQAARALVYKWKCMVAAEESDEEGDHNDSTINRGYGNGKDSYDNKIHIKQEKQEQNERTTATSKPEQRHSTHHTNGDTNGSKRKYQSSEEEEPETKRSKHSSSDRDCTKRKYENTSEQSDSDDKSDDSEDSDSSESSEEDIKPPHKIKVEPLDRPIKTEPVDKPSKPTKESSTSYNHVQVKKEPSSSKTAHSSSDKPSKHHSTESKHSESSSSREKSHSSHRDKHVSDKQKSESSEKKHKSDKDKQKDSKSSSKHSSDNHKSSSQNIESPPEKHSSSHKTDGGSERHRSSSQKNDSGSEKHKSHSDKTKYDKHSSSSSKKQESDRHNSSSSKELANDKNKSSDSISTGSKNSSSKDKSKHSSSSKEKSSSSKSDKKHSSSSEKSKNGDSKDKDKKVNKHSEKKSSHSSSSSHKSKSKEEKPKKNYNINNEDSDNDGIDCGSGASFAEALGMITPTKTVKKKSSVAKDHSTPNSSTNNDLSAAAMLAPTAKLAPLPALEISALPDISPNYKPRPPPKFLPHFDEDAMNVVISSKNQRTKVYSGNKILGKIPTLYEMCVQVLQEHIDALEYTGGVPYDILKPVVDKATPQQLFMLEHYNPYLMDDTDHLWQKFCEKNFRNKKREEMETWREMYMRCQEEQEHRLKSLTANIRMTQEAKKAPIKQTKMAYVDSIVKPPRNIARKQALHGTARAAAASPAARVASLARAPGVLKGGARPPPVPVSAAAFRPKKAPLMQKALQFMRGGRKR